MIDPDDLAQDFDLQFQCAALAIALAAGLMEGEETTEAMVQVMALWPENVPEQAATIGYRVAMILANNHGLDPEDLGAVAAHLLSADTIQPTQEADSGTQE